MTALSSDQLLAALQLTFDSQVSYPTAATAKTASTSTTAVAGNSSSTSNALPIQISPSGQRRYKWSLSLKHPPAPVPSVCIAITGDLSEAQRLWYRFSFDIPPPALILRDQRSNLSFVHKSKSEAAPIPATPVHLCCDFIGVPRNVSDAVKSSRYLQPHAFLLCYDVTDRNTWGYVQYEIEQIRRFGDSNAVVIICAITDHLTVTASSTTATAANVSVSHANDSTS
jgi:hypothetical protein